MSRDLENEVDALTSLVLAQGAVIQGLLAVMTNIPGMQEVPARVLDAVIDGAYELAERAKPGAAVRVTTGPIRELERMRAKHRRPTQLEAARFEELTR